MFIYKRLDMFIHLWSKDFQFPMLYILILYIGRLHCGVNCKCREFLGCNFDSKDCCSVLVLEYENFVFYYSNCPKHSCVSVVTAYAPASVVHPVLGYKLLPCFQIKTSSLYCCNESPALISSCCCSLGRGRGPLGEAGPWSDWAASRSDAASSATTYPFSWAVAVWFPAPAMGCIHGEQGCRAVLTLISTSGAM